MAGNIKGITIELNGDTTKLSKALDGVNKQSKDLNQQLKEVQTGLKFNPGNSDLIAQKQRILAESVQNTKEKLATLKNAAVDAEKQLAAGKMGQDEFDALRREIIKTENQLARFEKQLKDVQFERIGAIGKKFEEVGDKVTAVGKKMSMAITGPIVAIGAASVAAWKEVDDGLDTITTKTGATGAALDGLHEDFKRVYGDMPVTAQEVGDAIGEMNTQFGMTGAALQDASEYALKFAKINGADVTASVQNARSAIDTFGLSANDLPGVLDAVTKVSQNTGVSVDSVFQAVKKGAPTLKELGLNFAESASIMGRFEQAGIESEKALSLLSKAQVNFAKDGMSMQDGLALLQERLSGAKSSQEQLTVAAEYFGSKGAVFMLDAVKRGALDFNELASAAKDSAGAVGKTFADIQDPADKAQAAFNKIKLAGATIGEAVIPALLPLVEAVAGLAEKFAGLPEPVQKVILVIAGILAAIGPLIVIIGTVISAVGTIIGFVSTIGPIIAGVAGPIGWVILAIGAVIAIGVAVATHWEEIKAKAMEIWGAISGFFSGLWESVKAAWEGFWEGIKGFLSAIWDGIKQNASAVWEGIKTVITAVWTAIKSFIDAELNGIKAIVQTAWDIIKAITSGDFGALKDIVIGIWDSIKAAIQKPIEAARDLVKGAIDKIKSFMNFEWKLPELKLPHFSIQGSFSLDPPSVPHFGIEWYNKGGIFTGPTVIGVGESRPEFVGALEDLKSLLLEALRENNANLINGFTVAGAGAGGPISINLVVDGRTLAKSVYSPLQDITKQKGVRR